MRCLSIQDEIFISQSGIMALSDRLKELRTKKGYTQSRMAEILGIKQSSYNNYEKGIREPGYELLTLLSSQSEINLHWLLTGTGEMFTRKEISAPVVRESGSRYYSGKVPAVVTVSETENNTIVMVSTKVAAGYLRGYTDPEFFRPLPTFSMPMLRNGTYRAFQVTGDSMYPTLKESDWVIAEWIDPEHFRDDRVYVVVCKEGILVKRCLNRLASDDMLVAKSDNVESKLYPVRVISRDEILEVWEVRGLFSVQLPNPSELWTRLQDVEGRLAIMDQKLQDVTRKLP